jgi:hypothetical protein
MLTSWLEQLTEQQELDGKQLVPKVQYSLSCGMLTYLTGWLEQLAEQQELDGKLLVSKVQ